MYHAWYITAAITAVTVVTTVINAELTDVFAIRCMSSIVDISAMIADIYTIADVSVNIVSKAGGTIKLFKMSYDVKYNSCLNI